MNIIKIIINAIYIVRVGGGVAGDGGGSTQVCAYVYACSTNIAVPYHTSEP